MANGSGVSTSSKMKMLKLVVTLSLFSLIMVLSTVKSEAATVVKCPKTAGATDLCEHTLKNDYLLQINCPENKLSPANKVCPSEVKLDKDCADPQDPDKFLEGLTIKYAEGHYDVKAPNNMVKGFKKTAYLLCKEDSNKGYQIKMQFSSANGLLVSLGVVSISLLSSFVAWSS